MFRIGDYSFSPLARYIAPENDAASGPVVFRQGGTRFPSITFWRSRYGYADRSMQPQFAEWLAQDFQELEAYRFGLCIRVLDYLYEESLGGSADEREAVLAELDALVAAGEVLQLRVCVTQPQYRHYRLQFFRDHTATDMGFWRRLALVYARLAGGGLGTADSVPSQPVWCHALLEEALGFACPAFTPELIAALVAVGASDTAEVATSEVENGDNDGNEALPERASDVVEILDAELLGDPYSAESPAFPEAVLVDMGETRNPAVQIGNQLCAPSNLDLATAGESSAPHARFEIETDTLPGVRGTAFVGIAIEPFVSRPPPSRLARFSHCRAPPYGNTMSVIALPRRHGPFAARGPPATKNQEPRTVVVFPVGTDSHPHRHHFTHVVAHRWLRTLFDIFSPSSACPVSRPEATSRACGYDGFSSKF